MRRDSCFFYFIRPKIKKTGHLTFGLLQDNNQPFLKSHVEQQNDRKTK